MHLGKAQANNETESCKSNTGICDIITPYEEVANIDPKSYRMTKSSFKAI